MNIEQVAAVLAKIKIGDNRQVTPLVIAEWHDTIGHVPYEDAIEAVRMHRRESTEWLTPAHLLRNVGRITGTRLPPRVGGCAHRDHPQSPGFCVICGERIYREASA